MTDYRANTALKVFKFYSPLFEGTGFEIIRHDRSIAVRYQGDVTFWGSGLQANLYLQGAMDGLQPGWRKGLNNLWRVPAHG